MPAHEHQLWIMNLQDDVEPSFQACIFTVMFWLAHTHLRRQNNTGQKAHHCGLRALSRPIQVQSHNAKQLALTWFFRVYQLSRVHCRLMHMPPAAAIARPLL
jgi:hypothetical protein